MGWGENEEKVELTVPMRNAGWKPQEREISEEDLLGDDLELPSQCPQGILVKIHFTVGAFVEL